jgi:hypothetical protein
MRAHSHRLLVLGAGLAAIAVQLPIFDRAFALLDEGYVLALADDINRGKVLYRDVDVAAPFPGVFYLLAWWFRVAGTSVWSSRLLAVAIFAVHVTLVVRIAREFLPARHTLGLLVLLLCYRIWAFPHWHMLSYSSLSATFLGGAVVVACHHLRRPSHATLFFCGALVGAAIACKQDYGVGVGSALGLFLLARPLLARRAGVPSPGALAPAAVFAAGAAGVVLPVVGYFASHGALGQFIEQTVFRPLAITSAGFYVELPALRPLLRQDMALRSEVGSYFPGILTAFRWPEIAASWLYRETAVWDIALKAAFYAPFVLWALAAALWRPGVRRDTAPETAERRLLLLAWAGGFLLAFNPPRDWVHLMMIYPPALVLGSVLAAECAVRLPRRLAVGAAFVVLLALAGISLDLARDMRRHFDWPLPGTRAGIYADAHHGPILGDLLRYIDEHAPPGAPVPSYPFHPMIGFLAAREGVGGYYVIWPGEHAGRDQRIIAELRARDVPVIAYSASQYAHLGRFRDIAPELHDYLARTYRMDAVFARETYGPILAALGRRPAAPAGRSLLDSIAEMRPADSVASTLWPFAPVLAEKVGTPAAPLTARMSLDVPAGRPGIAFSYGVNPDRWLDAPSGPFTFAIDVAPAADAAPTTAFRATVDPHRNLAERRWIDGEIDLAGYAGRRVTLAFSIMGPGVVVPDPLDLAGWADPRLVMR